MPHVEFSRFDKTVLKALFLILLFSSGVWFGERYQPVDTVSRAVHYVGGVENRAPQAIPISGRTYVVKSGDTVYAISQKFDVHPDALKFANDIGKSNRIVVGQWLVIP